MVRGRAGVRGGVRGGLVVSALAAGVLALALGGCGGERDGARGGAQRDGVVAGAGAGAGSGVSVGADGADGADGAVSPAADARRVTVLIAGTSLTAGLGLEPDSAYLALLQRRVDEAGLPFEVVNAGVSGETSSGLLRRLDWLLRGDFAVIVVETGANDGLRGLPVEAIRANLDSIVVRVRRARPEVTVALVQMEALPNFGRSYTGAFRGMYPEVSRAHGAVLLPFLLDGVAGDASLNQADGIHPNEAGARRVAENVWVGLRPVLERVAAELDRRVPGT
jgi:acyl-CoA thioesterase I